MLASPRSSFLVALLSALLVTACAGDSDDGGDGSGADGGVTIDGAGGGGTCPVASSLGALGAVTGEAEDINQGGRKITFVHDLVPTYPKDVLQVALIDNLGTFAEGTIEAGTYPITGEETSFLTCGVCVNVIGDIVQ